MSSTFLTPEEIAELTGRKIASLQIEWLRKNGFRFWENAAHKPVVPRSAIDGLKEVTRQNVDWQPNIGVNF